MGPSCGTMLYWSGKAAGLSLAYTLKYSPDVLPFRLLDHLGSVGEVNSITS